MAKGARLFGIIAAAIFSGATLWSAPESVAAPATGEALYDDAPPMRIASLEIPDNFPRLCRRFALLLETRHFLQKPLDASVSRQAWSNYISRLDYDHSVFIQPDIDEFKAWQDVLHRDLKRGDLTFAVTVFERFRQRLRERSDFVSRFLNSEHDFTIDEDYTWKRKDAPWPASIEDQNELWLRRMKNELLTRIAARDFKEERDKAEAAEKDESAKADETEVTEASAESDTSGESGEVAEIESGDVAGEAEDKSAVTPPAIDMSPEAVVKRRYKQYLDIVEAADADYVIERFLCSFSEVYDPHTAYMPPTRAEDFNIEMNLTLCGIGATLQYEDGMAKIVKIIPGGPADRDTREIRLRDGDKIFGVGQGDGPVEDIVHLPLDKIVKRIRGDKGTKVVLHVISAADPSGATTKVVDLIRDDIKLEESAATGRVVRVEGRAFGYVRLPSFYGTMTKPYDPDFRSCTIDVMDIVGGFNDEVEGMILDLRGNGGGSLREAVTLAGSFIRQGPIVAVRESRGVQPLVDTDPDILFKKPLVVMIDRTSASASEIVAAALQDYGRAVIVGDTKSHGKGSVQNITPLIASDESYGTLKITIAAFYRVNGRSTQLDGVDSDIVLPSIFEYMDIGEDKLPSALPATRIPPLAYTISYPIGSLLPSLRKKSEARLASNEEWKKHKSRVEHVKEIANRTTLPLSYEKRMDMLRADAEFDVESETDLFDEPVDDEDDSQKKSEDSEDGIGRDIVLREAFNILADLSEAQEGKGISASQDSDVSDWIYRLFKQM